MSKKLWGGRFSKKTDPLVEKFTKSIKVDKILAYYDVLGSIMHLAILYKAGLIESSEREKLYNALMDIIKDIEENRFDFDEECEDIHTNIQNAVSQRVNDDNLAFKLHTARSRNTQVVFDLKLFCITWLSNIKKLCSELNMTLENMCDKEKGIIIPGYTHLQHAQLVYLSHYLGAYVEMLKRDVDRLEVVKNNIGLFLGAGALAGAPKIYTESIEEVVKELIKDKKYMSYAKAMGFNIQNVSSVSNSLDNISDRDFVIETLSALSILGMHLSRLAEDLIIWSTKEFGFIEIDDAFATGSSLMPQKKNPDVLELIRGYTGTLYGNLMSVLTMMKGLPLTYNRDMQLDKPPLFSSFEIVTKELKVLAKLIETLKWNKEAIKKRIDEDETLYATDLVYYLVKKGIPFKSAHDIIGKLVKFSIENNMKIKDMTDAALKEFSDNLKHDEIVKLMDPVVSVKSRISVKRSQQA